MKPFRFGLIADAPDCTPGELADLARQTEDRGYDTLLFPDHLGMLAPLVSLPAAAAATSRLRLGPLVINNDLRHPAVLAQEVATADLLSAGRVELGLGAGHMKAELDAIGLRFDPADLRIQRMEESAQVLRRLLAAAAEHLVAGHGWDIDPSQLLDSPFVLLGPPSRIVDQLLARRQRFGISYIAVFQGRAEGFDNVVAALAGS